ncbi:biotin--[acetyl-CoA-carboxylase] ligase [Paludibacter sp.]
MQDNYLYIKETNSTNVVMKQKLRENASLPDFFVIHTDFQTDGKGQIGNKWESEESKNLLFSILLHPTHIAIPEQFIISQLISVCIVETLQEICIEETENFTVKWPNDIYYKDKKIGGILVENVLRGSEISSSTVGIGLNINQEMFISDAKNPISLKQITNKNYDIIEILKIMIEKIKNIYIQNDYVLIRKKYMNVLYRKLGFHQYNSKNKTFSAKIIDIADDGKLSLMSEDGAINNFYFKEVEFVL